MSRRVLFLAAAALGAGGLAIALWPSSPAPASDRDGVAVLIARHALPAGKAIDPAQVAVVRVPAAIVPRTALTEADQVAFRIPAVAIPPGLPIVPSLLRKGAGATTLAAGERAVGVRVDDVTGLPGLLDAGSEVDLVIGSGETRIAVDGAGVLARPRRTSDGGWAVALRLPARLAETVADAQTAGAGVRLLARGDAG
jgi:pilus assembly protein CpaB